MTVALEYSEVTMDDFVTGLFAALADMGFQSISLKTSLFYRSAQQAFEGFREAASAAGLPVDFDIEVDRYRHDCRPLRAGITRAVQRDLISLDNPVFLTIRLKIAEGEGQEYLESVPGEQGWYRDAAQRFVDAFRGMALV